MGAVGGYEVIRGYGMVGDVGGHWVGGSGGSPGPDPLRSPQEVVGQFRAQVGTELGRLRGFLGALEAALGAQAGAVAAQAAGALQAERNTLSRYLDQLREMEAVLGDVHHETQTEFLRVRGPQRPPSLPAPWPRPPFP